jgi:hypothetical protein
MNKLELQGIRNNNSQLIRMSNRSGNHANCIKISKGETKIHRIAKSIACSNLIDEDFTFYTEAIIDPTREYLGGRADIFILENANTLEILHTETIRQCTDKNRKYPGEVIPLKAEDVIKDFIMDYCKKMGWELKITSDD